MVRFTRVIVVVFIRFFIPFMVLTFVVHRAFFADLQVLTEHFPPYQIVDVNDNVSGFSADIVNKMLNRAGYPATTTILPWARAYEVAKSQPNTILYSVYRTPEREKEFHWLGRLTTVETQIYVSVHAKAVQISSLHEAQKYNAVAVRKSATAEDLREMGFIENVNLLLVNDYQSVWTILNHGRADFTYSEPPNPILLSSTGINIDDFTALSFYSKKRNLYVAASLDTDPNIVDSLTKSLAQVTAETSL